MALSPIVVVPARLKASRLPEKPLAEINGRPMIAHVLERARAADAGPVLVACDDPRIAEAARVAGGEAVHTREDHPSGSDRVHEAVEARDPDGGYDVVVNVQGDLPAIDPAVIRRVLAPLEADPETAIATLVAPVTTEAERDDPAVVKAAVAFADGASIGRALYFSRATIPWGDGPRYHHIGLYAYRREALRRFVSLAPGVLEQREKLEQLRALEAGMRLDAAFVDTVPLGVDTPAHLDRARTLLAGN